MFQNENKNKNKINDSKEHNYRVLLSYKIFVIKYFSWSFQTSHNYTRNISAICTKNWMVNNAIKKYIYNNLSKIKIFAGNVD